jgi:hypothetical protein
LELIFFMLSLYQTNKSIMEEPLVVLQVALHDNDGIEIRIGGGDKVNPLMLVGILEQVKAGIINDLSLSRVDHSATISNQSYEA